MPKKRTTNLGLNLPPRMYWKHGAFWHMEKRTRKWKRLGTDYKKALELYCILESDTTKVNTVNDMIAAYIVEELPKLAPKTQEGERGFLRPLRAVFGTVAPQSIKPNHIYTYLQKRKDYPTAAKHEINLLKKIYSYHIMWGKLDFNPCAGVKMPKLRPRKRGITLREFAAVKRLASKEMADIMEFAFVTSARQGEIIRLNKSDVKNNKLMLEDTKTEQTFSINISKRLQRILDRQAHDSEALFVSARGERWTQSGLQSAWQKLIKKALDNKVVANRFTLHDIRAAAITHVANREGLEAARNVAGHKTTQMTGRVYYRGVKERKTSL